MAISVADNFSYKGAKPLDARVQYNTVADMKATVENTLYDGCMAYVKATKKYYTFDSSNEEDVTLGRWRESETGTTITIDSTPTEGSTNAVQSGGTYTALNGKVDKVNGKGLSTEDYTTAEKTKLSGVAEGAQVNTISSITLNGDAVTPDANKNVALTVITNTVNNLLNYYLKTETYSKTEVDTLLSAVSGATFESVSELPTTNIKTNVIYLVPKQTPETSNIKDEYINLDGTTAGWELIGDTGIDLSDYVTTTALNTALADYTTTADLTTLLSGKVDKVNGKQLSTEDYTSAEKTKLAGLSNYDDTALSGRVSDIEDVVPSTATTSNKLATMADVVIGAGGHIIEDSTGVDMTTRTNLQFVGASVTDDSTNDRTVVTVNTSDKADKVSSATNGNLASLDNNGNLADSGVASSDVVTTSSTAGLLKNDGTVDTTSYVSDISGKADKVTSATSGDLAGLDANGNITDSGVASNIFPSTATSSNKLATMADVGSGSGHIIEDSTGTDMTARTNLQFVGATVTDDSTNDRTVITVENNQAISPILYNDFTEGKFAGYIVNQNNKYKKVYVYSYSKSADIDTPIITATSPIMTSNTTPSPYVVSSSHTYSPYYADWKAFQSVEGTVSSFDCWSTYGSRLPQWLKIDMNTPIVFNEFKIRPRTGGAEIMVASFRLEASNDDENWVELTEQTFPNQDALLTYSFTNATAYRYYRFVALTTYSGSGDACIGRMQYLHNGSIRNMLHIETVLDRSELYYDNTKYLIKYTRSDEDWEDLP